MINKLEIFLIVLLTHPTNIVISVYNINNVFMQFLLLVFLPYLCIINSGIHKYSHIILLLASMFKKRPKEKYETKGKEYEIVRGIVIILVTIAIFACDFSNFPMRHLKTKFYGMSLMDLGVGSFLFNNGLFISRRKRFSILKSSFILFLLGVIRLMVIVCLRYSVDETEYGYHLNFYFVLSLVYLLYLIFNTKYSLILCGIILMTYQGLLSNGLNEFVFYAKRETFFEKNREGILMIFPSYCILVFSEYLGKIILQTQSNHQTIYKMLLYVLSFFICLVYAMKK